LIVDIRDYLIGLFADRPSSEIAAKEATTESGASGNAESLFGPFTGWVQRPDALGQLGWESPDLTEEDRWWADDQEVEMPDPCPTCDSLELWWDLLGGVHCQRCERETFRRSLRLLDRAEAIRRRHGQNGHQPTEGRNQC
jgi:hypothetical protein